MCPTSARLDEKKKHGLLISFSCVNARCRQNRKRILPTMLRVQEELEKGKFATIMQGEPHLTRFEESANHFSSMLSSVSSAWKQRDLVRNFLARDFVVMVNNFGFCPLYNSVRMRKDEEKELLLQKVLRHGLPKPDLEVVVGEVGSIISAKTDKHCVARFGNTCVGERRGNLSFHYYEGNNYTMETLRTNNMEAIFAKILDWVNFIVLVENRTVTTHVLKSNLSSSCPDLTQSDHEISPAPSLMNSPPSSPSSVSSEECEVDVML